MENVFPPASDLAKGSVAPGNNLNNWTNLKEGEDAVWSGDVKNTWGKFNYTIKIVIQTIILYFLIMINKLDYFKYLIHSS